MDVVNALGVELVLELVGNLLFSVSPVCHMCLFDCIRLGFDYF